MRQQETRLRIRDWEEQVGDRQRVSPEVPGLRQKEQSVSHRKDRHFSGAGFVDISRHVIDSQD